MGDSATVAQTTANSSGAPLPVKKDDVPLVVPEETQKQFPDLVELITHSESMNNSERNYWLQVLPVMTEPQVAELRDILETEKKKLSEIDKKYAKKEVNIDVEKVEQERRTALEDRKRKEAEARKNEDPDAILAQLQMV